MSDLCEVIKLDTSAMRWAVEKMYGHRLEALHGWPHLGPQPLPEPDRAQDQGTNAHRQFYRLAPRVQSEYRRLAAVLGPLFCDEPYVVQAVPTFRIHFPGSRAVGEAHTEMMYGHQAGEITFWVPLTKARYTNTVWIADRVQGWDSRTYSALVKEGRFDEADETLPEPVKMYPVNLDPGEVLVFDSVHRVHGNFRSAERWTRVSLDFRVMPRKLLEDFSSRHQFSGTFEDVDWGCRTCGQEPIHPDHFPVRRSVNTGVPMTLGGYWTDAP
jgi:hypothetical protein